MPLERGADLLDYTNTAWWWHCHRFATDAQILNDCDKIYMVIINYKETLKNQRFLIFLVTIDYNKY